MGHWFRGLVVRSSDDQQEVRDGVFAMETSCGVVCALIMSVSIPAMDPTQTSITPTTWMGFYYNGFANITSFMCMWCILVSTCVLTLMAFTPKQDTSRAVLRLKYIIAMPIWFFGLSCYTMMCMMMMQLEMNAANPEFGGSMSNTTSDWAPLVWATRIEFGISLTAALFAGIAVMFFPDWVSPLIGVTPVHSLVEFEISHVGEVESDDEDDIRELSAWGNDPLKDKVLHEKNRYPYLKKLSKGSFVASTDPNTSFYTLHKLSEAPKEAEGNEEVFNGIEMEKIGKGRWILKVQKYTLLDEEQKLYVKDCAVHPNYCSPDLFHNCEVKVIEVDGGVQVENETHEILVKKIKHVIHKLSRVATMNEQKNKYKY